MLGNVNWCCISTTKRIYYCECSILSRATLCGKERCSSSSRPSILAQCLALTSLEQYLNSGTVTEFWNNVWYQELWNNNGLALDINRYLSLSAGTQPHSNIITSEYICICPYNSSMSIANFQYFHNQRWWRIAVKQIQLGSTNVSDVNQGWML